MLIRDGNYPFENSLKVVENDFEHDLRNFPQSEFLRTTGSHFRILESDFGTSKSHFGAIESHFSIPKAFFVPTEVIFVLLRVFLVPQD